MRLSHSSFLIWLLWQKLDSLLPKSAAWAVCSCSVCWERLGEKSVLPLFHHLWFPLASHSTKNGVHVPNFSLKWGCLTVFVLAGCMCWFWEQTWVVVGYCGAEGWLASSVLWRWCLLCTRLPVLCTVIVLILYPFISTFLSFWIEWGIQGQSGGRGMFLSVMFVHFWIIQQY